jgi:hypothetical protein
MLAAAAGMETQLLRREVRAAVEQEGKKLRLFLLLVEPLIQVAVAVAVAFKAVLAAPAS